MSVCVAVCSCVLVPNLSCHSLPLCVGVCSVLYVVPRLLLFVAHFFVCVLLFRFCFSPTDVCVA